MVCCRSHHCLCHGKKLTPFDLDEVIHGEKVELFDQVGWKLLELVQDPEHIKDDDLRVGGRRESLLYLRLFHKS